MTELPIDVVDPNQRPPRFRWKQTVDTIAGRRTITNEGVFPPGIEEPVAALIALCKAQAREIALLRKERDDFSAVYANAKAQQPAPQKKRG